ncbi:MAG: DUF2750 domain-containing protein [Hahellaceae bacterium]|nr:DUF2750 domain-containing protein [Hahellaceae bacterium]MCP5169159.1 DUF2750 domain-containing protein [Hahellaceae bacterium]
MSQPSSDDLLKLDCEARYDYFLSEVSDSREIWILINANEQFLKIYSEEDGFEYLPVWPNADVAQRVSQDETNDLTPKAISLPEFFKKWIPGLQRDGLQVGVFPAADQTVWITDPTELGEDLKEELSHFG